jgi:hypothetical protein
VRSLCCTRRTLKKFELQRRGGKKVATEVRGSTDLETRIRRLEDIEAIKQLKYHQMAVLDKLDPKAISECYTEDALWEGGTERRDGRKVIEERMTNNFKKATWFFHAVVNPEIEIDSDGLHAKGAWKLLEWMISNGKRQWMLGRFEDKYRKVDGQWLVEYSHWSREFQAEVLNEVMGPA